MAGVARNSDASENFDAELAKEAIAQGEEKVADINVAADYEASKQFSVSEIDKTKEGAQAAEAATASDRKLPQPDESLTASNTQAKSDADPADYREMARDVSQGTTGASNVSDDLVEKALEMGQPSESK